MINSIEIDGINFKIDDLFLFASSYDAVENCDDLTVYSKTRVPTVVKTSEAGTLNETLKQYKETLNEHDISNFALVADRFLINMDNVSVNMKNYNGDYVFFADLNYGPTLQLFSSPNKEDVDAVINEYKDQENFYIQNSHKTLVLDKPLEETTEDTSLTE